MAAAGRRSRLALPDPPARLRLERRHHVADVTRFARQLATSSWPAEPATSATWSRARRADGQGDLAAEAHRGPPPGGRHRKNTYASETPVTDGERLYALFGGNVGVFASRSTARRCGRGRGRRSRSISTSARRRRRWSTTAASISCTTTTASRSSPRSTRRPGEEIWTSSGPTSTHGSPRLGDAAHLEEREAHRDRHHRPRLRHQLRPRRQGAVAAEGHPPVDAQPGRRRRPALRRVGSQGEAEPAAACGAAGRHRRHHAQGGRDRNAFDRLVPPRFSGYTPSPLAYRGRIYAVNDNGVLQVADAADRRRSLQGAHRRRRAHLLELAHRQRRTHLPPQRGRRRVRPSAPATLRRAGAQPLGEMRLASPAAAGDRLATSAR